MAEEIETGKEIEKIAHNEILVTANAIKKVLEKKGHKVKSIKLEKNTLAKLKSNFDFIFNLAEDTKGDMITETKVPSYLGKLGIPYTGSDEKGLTNGIDKAKTKEILIKNKIPTPKFQILDKNTKKIKLNFPLMLEPLHTDGGIGIDVNSFVRNKKELNKKVKEIIKNYKQPVLAEEYIEGREINAPIIGNKNNLKVLPLLEVVFNYPKNIPKILTYESKWVKNSRLYKESVLTCPIQIDKKLKNKIENTAKKVFLITGCNDYARIDFRIKDNVPYVLEVNPNPCLNPGENELIKSAKAAGYSYDKIINEIFNISLKRWGLQLE